MAIGSWRLWFGIDYVVVRNSLAVPISVGILILWFWFITPYYTFRLVCGVDPRGAHNNLEGWALE